MENINVLALAYLGDAIYECHIREYLIHRGFAKVKALQAQAVLYARNHKSHKSPKNTDVSTYKYATGLEALIGYLYIEKKKERIRQIMKYIIGESICISMEKM